MAQSPRDYPVLASLTPAQRKVFLAIRDALRKGERLHLQDNAFWITRKKRRVSPPKPR